MGVRRVVVGTIVGLLLLGGQAVAAERRPLVVGGAPAPASYGFVAALLRPTDGRHFCGGALIRPTWVVTAAHCALPLQGTAGATLLLGRADWTGTGGEEHAIKAVTRHPSWSQTSPAGDIALIELARPSAIAPVPVLTAAQYPTWDGNQRQGTVAGWGYTVPGSSPSNALRSAAIPVYAPSACERLDPSFTSELLLCAGNAQATACNGDSGGPLLAADPTGRFGIVGVSSRGPQVCGRSPSFYTRLAGYADWMGEVMGAPAPPPTTPTTTPSRPVAAPAYSLLGADGTVHSFGAGGLGGAGACRAGRSCVDLAARPGGGYWVSRGSCELGGFGPAPALRSPVTEERCSITAHSSGKGVWALTPSGRVFAVGAGSVPGQPRPRPKASWQQVEARPQGDGYWTLASDGTVAGFGGAKVLAGGRLAQPVAAMTATPSGAGYWLVGRDGSVAAFGDARSFGSTAGKRLGGPIVDVQRTASGAGYWLFGSDGAVFGFGDAKVAGSAAGRGPIVAAIRR